MPFRDATKLCKEFLLVSISATMAEQVVSRVGYSLHKAQEKKGRLPYAIAKREKDVDTLYIEADGAMVPLLFGNGREYKENKLGIVFNNKDIHHCHHKDGTPFCEIYRKKMVSSLAEGVEPFKKMLYAAAVEKGVHRASQVIFLSDGASWLGKCKEEYFPDAIQILDWYHAVEHLWVTAHTLFGEANTEKCREWVTPLEELLWEGRVDEVIKKLTEMALSSRRKQQTALFELRGYYVSNKANMNYAYYRENGWYIGSCAIESANKYVVAQRLKLSGMQWKTHTADAMIWARCKYFENEWDFFWNTMEPAEYLNQPVQIREAA